MSSEYEKARAWRLSHNLSQLELGKRLGYSREAIGWFEAGLVPPTLTNRNPKKRLIKEWVWQRYRLACAGLDAEMRAERHWNWPKGEAT